MKKNLIKKKITDLWNIGHITRNNLIITTIIDTNFYRDVGIAWVCFWSTTNRNGRRLCEARNDLHRSCHCSRKQVDASVGTFACIRTPRLCCSVKVRILCRSRNILKRRDRSNGSLKREIREERRHDFAVGFEQHRKLSSSDWFRKYTCDLFFRSLRVRTRESVELNWIRPRIE